MIKANEEKVMSVGANLFRGIEAVGGRMNITNSEVIFKSHKINIQSGPLTIKIQDIKDVGKRNTLFIVPNGLKVVLNSGEEYKFVVNKRAKVIEYLKSQIGKINDGNSININSES